MWFKIKSFILFLIKSNNQHGIHSPFIYNLVTKCFYNNTNSLQIKFLNNIRKTLYANNELIKINDFGSGSKIFTTNERKVSDIAKVSGITKKRTLLLLRIMAYFKPAAILEIGTSVGLGTSTLSVGNQNARITTLEGCENTAAIANDIFEKFNLTNIQLIIGNFEDTLSKVVKNTPFDLIYFDGNHNKKATLQYFNTCLLSAHNNSVFIFDDINWSKEMQQAWNEIKNNSKVTVTIDTFMWGFVFFRKEQNKQHFTIRI